MMNRTFALLVVILASALANCPDGGYRFKNSCYNFFTGGSSWFGAWQHCVGYGAKLAQITSSAENEFLKSLSRASGHKWIWVDGNDIDQQRTWKLGFYQTMTYLDFGASYENNGDTNSNCLMLDRNHNYRWSDHPCSQALPFICETSVCDNQNM